MAARVIHFIGEGGGEASRTSDRPGHVKKLSASRERRDSVSNSVSAFFYKKSVGLEEENEIRTTALVVIDRLECVFLLQHSSSISREDDVP